MIEALATRYGIPTVDATSIEAFLAPAAGECPHALLFFTGDPKQRAESHDVAVVLPQLMAAFRGRLRAAVVAREAEAALSPRFHVQVFPSLVVTRGGAALGVLPRIRDWSDYRTRIDALLDPGCPAMAASEGPRVEFRRVGNGSAA